MTYGRTLPFSEQTTRWCNVALVLMLALLVFTARPSFATIDPGEITNLSATMSSTFDPVNGYSVTFAWHTNHPGNSIVIIETPFDYWADNNAPSRQIVQNESTTDHVVVVDHFPAYNIYGTWGYYVASNVAVRGCNVRTAVSVYGQPTLGR